MTRIAIDEDLCQGAGECLDLAPGAITLDELGIASVRPDESDLSSELARALVSRCPSMAISIFSPQPS